MALDNNKDASVISEIAALVRQGAAVHSVYDRKVLTHGDTQTIFTDPDAPEPKALRFGTLRAVVDYWPLVVADCEAGGGDAGHAVVQVASESCVRILVPIAGARRQQLVYAVAEPILPRLTLGQFMEVEDFLIQLLSSFRPGPQREALQSQAGRLKAGLLSEIEDDGISQSVSTRQGLTRAAAGRVENLFPLSPFRTFPEVEQPTIPFILRLQQAKSGDAMRAMAALFEADGGAWRPGVIAGIGEWLQVELPGVTILA